MKQIFSFVIATFLTLSCLCFSPVFAQDESSQEFKEEYLNVPDGESQEFYARRIKELINSNNKRQRNAFQMRDVHEGGGQRTCGVA